jgi:diguanylate cyclase (GGDEF)-like protein
MKKKYSKLLDGNQRYWDSGDWFEQTADFLVIEINENLCRTKIVPPPVEEHSIVEKLRKLIEIERQNNSDWVKKVNTLGVYFYTQKFSLVESIVSELRSFFSDQDTLMDGLLLYILARVQIEKMEYLTANDSFIRAYELLSNELCFYEKTEFFLHWCYLFIEANQLILAEKLLKLISSLLPPINSHTYTLMFFYLFLLKKKTHQTEATISYANLILPMQSTYLDFDQWYTLHLFCGEYYTSIDQDLEKTIHHLTMANTYLTNKWKEFVRQITHLKTILDPIEFLEVRSNYEDKLLQIVLESNLHNNHFITTLKNAYDELSDINKQVKEFSYLDSLTNLHNRRYLWDISNDFFSRARAEKVPISCFMIDIDDFKKLNDTFGHIEGDKVLRETCKIIKKFFRKSDIVIRFGGEEILVLLYNLNLENSIKLAQSLCQKIEKLTINTADKQQMFTTISIGISHIDTLKISVKKKVLDNMIDEADKQLYIAKTSGKNRVSYEG